MAGSRRDRRPAGPLHRHGRVAQRPDRSGSPPQTETFIKERKHAETGKVEPVGIDDACMFLAVFANGSLGTFESTRYARGRKNYNTFEINGENGAVFFDLEDPHILQFFRYADPTTGKKIEDHLTGWQRIHVTNFEHPYMKNWWVPGCTIGYEHTFINGLADFLASLEGGKPRSSPTSAAACGRRRSATPCWPAPRAASGWRFPSRKFAELSVRPAGRSEGAVMNYFAHGRPFVDDPYFLAGTAVPDWLNVVDRRVRVRSKQARLFVDSADAARGAAGRRHRAASSRRRLVSRHAGVRRAVAGTVPHAARARCRPTTAFGRISSGTSWSRSCSTRR